mgnify:CR=1 FL=1
MARRDPALPALPGYQTRVSGYSNIRTADPYTGRIENPVLSQFVEFSETALKSSVAIKTEEKRERDKLKAKAEAQAERNRLEAERDLEKQMEAQAKSDAYKSGFDYRNAVRNKALHPTQHTAYWTALEKYSGTREGSTAVAQQTSEWQKLVDANDPSTRDPHGFETHFNNFFNNFTKDHEAMGPYYTGSFMEPVVAAQLRLFGPEEKNSRDRMFEHQSTEFVGELLTAQLEYSQATNNAGRIMALGNASEVLNTSHEMAITNPDYNYNIGIKLIDAITQDKHNPEAAKAFIEGLETTPGSKLLSIKKLRAIYEHPTKQAEIDSWIEKVQETRETKFQTDHALTLSEASHIFDRYVNPDAEAHLATRKDATDELEVWYTKAKKDITDHINYDATEDRFIEMEAAVKQQYKTTTNRINTKSQNKLTETLAQSTMIALSQASDADLANMIV